MTPLLELRQVLVRRNGRPVLEVEQLAIQRGEVLAVLGPNGAGKSTLLLVLARVLLPERGEIIFQGAAQSGASDLAYRRRLGLVLQDPLLLDGSVLHNVCLGLRFRGWSERTARPRAQAWLERLGIGHLGDRPATQISGGEAQRVALARAFVLEPDLLLLDEPFHSLDRPMRVALLADLRQLLSETGTTTLFITHDPHEVEQLSSKAIALRDGRLVGSASGADGEPAA